MNYEVFIEKWHDLTDAEKINCFNDYAREHNTDEELFIFDEEFLTSRFSSAIDAARAVYFGKIESWNDEYIKFNGYGNLESLCEYQAAELADDYADNIYRYEEIWMQYIDEDEDEN